MRAIPNDEYPNSRPNFRKWKILKKGKKKINKIKKIKSLSTFSTGLSRERREKKEGESQRCLAFPLLHLQASKSLPRLPPHFPNPPSMESESPLPTSRRSEALLLLHRWSWWQRGRKSSKRSGPKPQKSSTKKLLISRVSSWCLGFRNRSGTSSSPASLAECAKGYCLFYFNLFFFFLLWLV